MMTLPPLRILMTADTVGGVWSYTLELLRALAPRRCEVMLATMGAPLMPDQQREAAQIPGLTVCESTYKLEWMDDPWADVDASGEWLMELAREFRPHVVHLNTYAHGALPWTVPVLMVGHSCVLSWWQAVKGEAAPTSWNTYQKRVRTGLAGADLVVAPTHAMLNALRTYYGPFRAEQVIYNARNPVDFEPEAKEEFVFAMGRIWDEAKNIAALDQIALQVPWPIYVAGNQQHPSGGQIPITNLHTLGYIEQHEIPNMLARASIYAHPARYEPFGLSALEAALSGCALVLGDIPSLREVWGDAAIYVPPDDTATLVEVLCELINYPKRRAAMGKAARTRAKRYSPELMAQAYWHAYDNLVAHTSTVPAFHIRQVAPSLPELRSTYHPTTL